MTMKIKEICMFSTGILFLIIFIFIMVKPSNTIAADLETFSEEESKKIYNTEMKQDILCLMLAYPGYITDVCKDTGGQVYIVMKSGTKILYDDRIMKNTEAKLAYPDLQDMMEQVYPLTPVSKLMDKNFDPGRVRVYSLLGEVYGKSNAQIQANLKGVGYGNQQFNGNNKAADSLKDTLKELTLLGKSKRDISACLYPINGTFNYRYIAGTNRLSPHAYGIAIDLARDNRDYWKWTTPKQGEQRLMSYSKELVEIFEKNNFIWGGKWSRFDILHFEYRPEIILKARYFGENSDYRKVWYEGIPYNDAHITKCIENIERALK